jgi:inner membrane protein
MDPPTHGLLGAAIGQALFGRTLGRRALVWGAVGGMLPDVDVVMTAVGPMGEWLYHRGLTHALWVPPVVGTILGTAIATRERRKQPDRAVPVAAWCWLFVLTMLSHPLLDLCTTYGTVLFAPFSNRRFAIDAIAIIDPVYSLALAAALVVGLARGVGSRSARVAAVGTLVFTTAYLAYGLFLNHQAERLARTQLAEAGIQAERINAYPTLLQLYLRRLVAHGGDEIHVGWISLWSPRRVEWSTFRQAEGTLVDEARQTREGRLFEWFTGGQNAAALESSPGAAVVEIDDLRFGFPSEPRHGLWGIRVRFDGEGRVVAPVERVDRPLPRTPKALLLQIWRQTFLR